MLLNLIDEKGAKMMFCVVETVELARDIWAETASIRGSRLEGFEVIRDDGTVAYAGNYVTDEC